MPTPTVRVLALLTVTLTGPADEQDGMPAHAYDLQLQPVLDCDDDPRGDIGVYLVSAAESFPVDGGVVTVWGGPPQGVPNLRPAVLRLPDDSYKVAVGKPDDGTYTVTLLATQVLP